MNESRERHSQATLIALPAYQEYPVDDMRRRAAWFYHDISRRRTVRDFSPRPVPRDVIEDCLRAAGTAPSGANLQPWHFVVVVDPEIKRTICLGAEKEEYEFYHHKARRSGWTRWRRSGPTSTRRFSRPRRISS